MHRLIGVFGLFVLIMLAYLFSTNRKAVNLRTIIGGVALQFVFALFILKTPVGMVIFEGARTVFTGILEYANAGASFVFGPLVDIPVLGRVFGAKYGFIFVFQVGAVIILTASLSAVLYYLRILQMVVWVFAKIMHWVMRISGAEALSCAANVFAGQTEAPLVVRPYLSKMTQSEMMTLMTGGFATIAGGVMAAYVGIGIDAGHLMTASVISAPAALVLAKLLVPETQKAETENHVAFSAGKGDYVNVIDAAAGGAKEGLYLSLNVMGMLIAFISLVALINGVLGLIGISLEQIFSYIFWPLSWLMGVPASECGQVGTLLGKKMVLNEFVAFIDLIEIQATLSERSRVIATYALCGFANFSSIAIQIGGIGTLVPGRKADLAKLGLRAMLAGTLACQMTASIAAILL